MKNFVLPFAIFINESKSIETKVLVDEDLITSQLYKYQPLDKELPIGYYELDRGDGYDIYEHRLKVERLSGEELSDVLELIKVNVIDRNTINSILQLDEETDLIDDYSFFDNDFPIKLLVTCTRTTTWRRSQVNSSAKSISGESIETSKIALGLEELGETKESVLDAVLSYLSEFYREGIRFKFND